MKISHGDTVIVLTGKDKGKKGTVLRVLAKEHRVIVSGINMITKHVKRTAQTAGQKIKYEASIHVSNVAVLDPKSGKATRIGYTVQGDKKVRVARKSGAEIVRTKLSADAQSGAVQKKASPFWKKSATTTGEHAASKPVEEPAHPSATTPHRSSSRGS